MCDVLRALPKSYRCGTSAVNADEDPRPLRRILEGHLFDFNADLGAVAINSGAACTPCMDRLFAVSTTLYPNGERSSAVPKMRKKHDSLRQKRKL